MKKNTIVELLKLTDRYKQNNLYIGAKGIVLNVEQDKLKVMFLNEQNLGDYAIVDVGREDVKSLNKEISESFMKLNKIKDYKFKEKGFKEKKFNVYDEVELIVEKAQYLEQGIHKGDTGFIVEDYSTQNYVLVDFGKVNKQGDYVGDCISVNLSDLLIKTKNTSK